MEIKETPLAGVFEIALNKHEDERGYFARCWDPAKAGAAGLNGMPDQWSFSFNGHKGTLRGLHWQGPPYGETKLVRCVQGEIWDVAVDIRPDSPTFGKWTGVYLNAKALNALYIPPGFAHGFITLADRSLVQYGIEGEYTPEYARGARWNDPSFEIKWPIEPVVINERDARIPNICGI